MPNHDDYEYYKKHGVCVWCQRREAEPGKILCYECAEKDRKRAHDKYYANHEKSLKNNRRGYARRREKRKALGICTRCGSRKAMPGHTLCLECNIKMNRYARERKRKNGAIPKEARMEGRIVHPLRCAGCARKETLPEMLRSLMREHCERTRDNSNARSHTSMDAGRKSAR